jgi:hypothetical protein
LFEFIKKHLILKLLKPPSIEELREFAKLNMDEKCFKTYLQLIEPNIKQIIIQYLGGWQSIESYTTQIMMRVNGVYKTSTSVLFDIDEDKDKFQDLVDLEKYQKLEKFSFKRKIDFLLKNKIIGNSTYLLLDFLRKKRNKIHNFQGYLSDEDRRWFEVGASILIDVYFAISSSNLDIKDKKRMIEGAEKRSLEIMKNYNDLA